MKIGDVIECEKGLALYIGAGEAVYSWGTVQRFEVGMVVFAIRYITGQGTSSEKNPRVHDLDFKITDSGQIESVRLSQWFTDCTDMEITIIRGYEYDFSVSIEPYTEEFNRLVFPFSDRYEMFVNLLRATESSFRVSAVNAGSFTFTATSLNGKVSACTVIIV